jgi:hypothetical protein
MHRGTGAYGRAGAAYGMAQRAKPVVVIGNLWLHAPSSHTLNWDRPGA